MMKGGRIADLRGYIFRTPIDIPIVTSFGVMHDRPALFVRIEDDEGAVGWGEIWCNFPSCGAEHRAALIRTLFAPLLIGTSIEGPTSRCYEELSARLSVLALQSGEPGPIAQCIGGIDIAIWDLVARRNNQPLWKYLGGKSARVPVYASGLNPTAPERLAATRRAEGYRAFKLKVGFGDLDFANLAALRSAIGTDTLMVDANQAWNLETAHVMAARMEPFEIDWLEEPLRADRPIREWCALAEKTPIGLAAGENIVGERNFAAMIDSHALKVVQPDVTKWGGISGCMLVARSIEAAGAMYCPHFLGAGIGLLASAHLLSAIGGRGRLEIDANENPLRTLTCGALKNICDGHASLDNTPGLGLAPDLVSLRAVSSAPK